MNAKQMIAAIAVFAATGSAFAIEVAAVAEQDRAVTPKARAEIRAEAVHARIASPLARADIEKTLKPAVLATKSA